MTRNEAAERLRLVAPAAVDAALAEERRHVIEQIRERYEAARISPYGTVTIPNLDAILDDLSTPEPLTDNQRKAIAQQALLSTPEQP